VLISDLQLALLGVGAVVIAGVVVYNTVVERRAKARAERAFGAEHPDVLFEEPTVRREPTLGRLPEDTRAEPTIGRIEPATRVGVEEGDKLVAEAAPGTEASVSNRIDTVAVILADDPVTREQLEPLLDSLQVHTTPVNVEGIVDEQWQPVESSSPKSWRELRAGLQLASRSGPLTEEEINTFNETIAGFAGAIGAVSQREAPSAAAQRARDLDRFCAEADIEVAVNVVGQFGATFALGKVKAIALGHGLSEIGSGDLVKYAPDGTPAYAVRRFDREGERAEASFTHGLTFALDLPHVADPGAAFDAMVALAGACASQLGGELVDDNRKPLSPQGLAAIRRSLEKVFRDMESHGIPAGSALARRLFS
jgi:FtsZ-interacting cell division protein ZipA